jgi:GNAT superfamily N-acetyltransferase
VIAPRLSVSRSDGYTISTDPACLDRRAVWEFLRTSYWSPGIEFEIVSRAIDSSLVFGLRSPDREQAGYARAIVDRDGSARLADVYVREAHRGRGLGVWLVQTMLEHPELRDRRLTLRTRDAHGLYERFGFRRAGSDELLMERPARPEPARGSRPRPA